MKKAFFALLIFYIMVSCTHKNGSGNIIRQNKNIGSFTGLDVAGSFDVEIKNGTSEEVVVEADDNVINYITIKVVDNELMIRLEETNISDAHLKIFITAPQINSIKASAAAQVTAKEELRSTGNITLTASSGAHIKAALDAPEIKAVASSGSEVNLSGHTKNVTAISSSGAAIRAGELLSENSYANASSGSNINIYASMEIDANASSGSKISYRGAASSIKKDENSGGEVEKDN